MRSFKFRMWLEDDETMLYDFSTDTDHFTSMMNETFAYWQNKDFGHRNKIMQYTGLKDIDGRDIYEGDIIEEEMSDGGHLYAEVVFVDGKFLGKEEGHEPEHGIVEFREGRVVGNIFEESVSVFNEQSRGDCYTI